jgi:hypothetical protein
VGGEGFAVDASLIAADANKQRSVPGSKWQADACAGRAVQEYLATLDDAAFGAASPVTPKFISQSDPAAQWTGAHKGHAFFAYATNYLIDTEHAVILDVEASRAIRQAEVGASRTMLDRTTERFGLKPQSLVADSAYGSAENLAWLVKQRGIAPHIPVFDKSTRTDGTLSRSDFTFGTEQDLYTCPEGKHLVQFHRTYATPRSGITKEGTRIYRASKRDCDATLKPRCCPNTPARKIPRDLYRTPATWPAPWPAHRPMSAHGTGARRSRCCSPTSSASSGSVVSDCADHAAPATSSSWPRPPRTSESSPSSDR